MKFTLDVQTINQIQNNINPGLVKIFIQETFAATVD